MCILHLLNSVSGHILFSDMFPQYKYAIGAGATELLRRKSFSPKPEIDSSELKLVPFIQLDKREQRKLHRCKRESMLMDLKHGSPSDVRFLLYGQLLPLISA